MGDHKYKKPGEKPEETKNATVSIFDSETKIDPGKKYRTMEFITIHDAAPRLEKKLNEMAEEGYAYIDRIVTSPAETVLIFEKK